MNTSGTHAKESGSPTGIASAAKDYGPKGPAQKPDMKSRFNFIRRHFEAVTNILVLILSVILIVWISLDTFNHRNILENHGYMIFQFWVCLFFMLDFFIGFRKARSKSHFFWTRIWFLLLSIPYLNIINALHLQLPYDVVNFVRFVPLARGGLAIFIVMHYLNSNAIQSLFMTYILIMAFSGYFCSLVFYQAEYQINAQVTSYWSALWWSAMNMTTVGCNIEPVTAIGKIVAVILPLIGMVILPLFTVYITNMVTSAVNQSRQNQ